MAPAASISFLNLDKLSKHSTFNPVVPSSYTSAEKLWSCLLEQAYSHDKLCIDKRMVLNKTTKRLQMIVKVVSVFEDTLCKAEHSELVAKSKNAIDAKVYQTSHCQCCVDHVKRVCSLETELEEKTQNNIDRERQICMLESLLAEKEKYFTDMDIKLTQCYAEIKELRTRPKMVSGFSSSQPLSTACLPSKEICVSSRAKGGAIAIESKRLNGPIACLENCKKLQSNKYKADWKKCKVVKSASLAMEQYRRSMKSEICRVEAPEPGYRTRIAMKDKLLKTCFACRGLGHIAKYCTSQVNETHRKYCSMKSFTYGHTGHISRNCCSTGKMEQRNQDNPRSSGKEIQTIFLRQSFKQKQNGGKRHLKSNCQQTTLCESNGYRNYHLNKLSSCKKSHPDTIV